MNIFRQQWLFTIEVNGIWTIKFLSLIFFPNKNKVKTDMQNILTEKFLFLLVIGKII